MHILCFCIDLSIGIIFMYVCIYICMHIYVGPYAYAHVCAVGLGTCKLKIVELFVELLIEINIHQSVYTF